ncbi:MAG: hypothetical protein AAFU67_15220, partial [Bacteroidota bacterium]
RGALTSIEDLKTWFELQNKTNWNLYRGLLTKIQNAPSIIHRQDDDTITVEESWKILEDLLGMYARGVGRFTIFVKDGKASSRGFQQHIELVNTSSAAGINGHPGVSGYVPKDAIKEAITEERKKWELERRIEDMEAAMDANQSIGERVVDHVFNNVDINAFAPAINGLFASLAGAIPQRQPISLQGMASEAANPATREVPNGYDMHAEDIMPPLTIIRQHCDSYEEFVTLLNATAEMFAQQPDVFKSMILQQ